MRSTFAATTGPPLNNISRGGHSPPARTFERTCVFMVQSSLVWDTHSSRGTSRLPFPRKSCLHPASALVEVHWILVNKPSMSGS